MLLKRIYSFLPVAALINYVALLEQLFAPLKSLQRHSQVVCNSNQIDRVIVNHQNFLITVKLGLGY